MEALNKLIFATAKSKEGIWEWSEGHNPKVLDMFAKAGFSGIKDDETPWCAAFVGAVLAECGLMPSGSLAARSYLKYGKPIKLEDAKEGDIVIFWRESRNSWKGHVALFVKLDKLYIHTLGGNQKNSVNVSRYPRDQLLAIRRAVKPRSHVVGSFTLNSVAAAATATVASGVQIHQNSLSNMALIPVAVILCFLALIFRERLIAWSKGWR